MNDEDFGSIEEIGLDHIPDPEAPPPQPVAVCAANTSVEGHIFSKVYSQDHPVRFVRTGQYMIDNPVLSVPSLIGDGVLPEEGSMICGGKIGMGKSMIVMNTLYDCCAGDPVMGLPELEVPRPLRVLYIEKEVQGRGVNKRFNDIHRLKRRSIAPKNFMILTDMETELMIQVDAKNTTCHAAEQTWMDLIMEYRPDIITGDPVSRMHTMSPGDEGEMMSVWGRMVRIRQMGKRLGNPFAWILVHHFRKSAPDVAIEEGLDDFRGSSVLPQSVDTRLLFRTVPGLDPIGRRHNFKRMTFAVVRQGEPVNDIIFWQPLDIPIPIFYRRGEAPEAAFG